MKYIFSSKNVYIYLPQTPMHLELTALLGALGILKTQNSVSETKQNGHQDPQGVAFSLWM